MNKTVPLILISMMLLASSCSKVSTTSGGFWAFNGNTYNAINCLANSSTATLTATNTVTGSTYSNIVIYFPDTLPTVSDTFIVQSPGNPPAAKQLSIIVGYMVSGMLNYYSSVGRDGKAQKVAVTVTNGKISVAGNTIEILNNTGTSDSTALNFNIRQTQ